MARRLTCVVAIATLALTGCIFDPSLIDLITSGGGNGGAGGSDFDSVAQVAPPLDAPPVDSAAVQVVLLAPTEFGGRARVTMRVAGRAVLTATRTVPAGGRVVVVGPDECDSVLIEATVFTEPPEILPIRVFFLGTDFVQNDTILFELRPTTPPDGDPNDPNEPPPADLEVRIEGLDAEQFIAAGTPVDFDVVVEGAVDGATLSAFADLDADAATGFDLTIVEDIAAQERNSITWDTTGVAPGLYAIFARVNDGDRSTTAGPGTGRVRINAPPQLVIDAPMDGLVVRRGQPLIIAWAGQDPDHDAAITILLDQDGALNGNETVLRDDISEDDVDDREFELDTSTIDVGTYFVLGRIDDGLESSVVIGPSFCVVNRRVGPFSPGQFVEGEATRLRGEDLSDQLGPINSEFGWSVDIREDIDLDGRADLIIGDPFLQLFDVDSGYRTFGGAYFHSLEEGDWPAELLSSELDILMTQVARDEEVGWSVALLGRLDDNSFPEVAVGTPGFGLKQDDLGAAYFVEGSFLLDIPGPLILDQSVDGFAVSRVEGEFDEDANNGERAGHVVAALGDLNGDGQREVAIGAPADEAGPEGEPGAGRAVIIFGGMGLPSGTLDDVFDPNFGPIDSLLLIGERVGDLAGYSIASAGRFDCDPAPCVEPADVLIGAPGFEVGRGRVYLIFGGDGMNQLGVLPLAELGSTWPGTVFEGSQAGELAGTSVSVTDFDGDGLPDLIIGAPGFGGGRGRTYVIYNSPELRSRLSGPPISLAEVGNTLPGVTIDGLAVGDLLGLAVSGGGDADIDGAEELIIGAPGFDDFRGRAIFIYGGQDLAGNVPQTDVGTCEVQGWLLTGDSIGDQVGWALSAGDVDGDGRADAAITAPGVNELGEAHLIFGAGGRASLARPEGPRPPQSIDPKQP